MYTGPDGSSCPICGRPGGVRAGELAFYLRQGSADSELWHCPGCRSWWRHFPEPVDLDAHFAVTSYSDPTREAAWRSSRQPFFDHLTERTLHVLGRPDGGIDVLDVGCAYGHLLETLAARGCRASGIEPVAAQRELLARRGRFRVFPSLSSATQAGVAYDAVLAIDSFYYMPGPPAERLAQMAALVKPGGILQLRIANRAPLLNARLRLGRPPTDDLFGDALFCYSRRGLEYLIGEAGLEPLSWHALEGKKVTFTDARAVLLNGILPLVAACTGWAVSPGITYVCRRPAVTGTIGTSERPLAGPTS